MRHVTRPEKAAILVVASAALVLMSTRGFAGPAAKPSASPSASASAAPRVFVEPVELGAQAIPSEKTKPPGRDEWAGARPVLTGRRTAASSTCTALLLREYLKVRCSGWTSGVRQFAGPIDDVEVWVSPANTVDQLTQSEGGGHVVFPLRRGVGHVFRFFGADFDYGGSIFPTGGPLVDAYWPAGDASPTVTIR
jgi:hypothetical protein